MFTIRVHILAYIFLAIPTVTWIRSTGESQEISILIGILCGVILALTDVLFQTIDFTGNRRKSDVRALNVNFEDIETRLKKLEE